MKSVTDRLDQWTREWAPELQGLPEKARRQLLGIALDAKKSEVRS